MIDDQHKVDFRKKCLDRLRFITKFAKYKKNKIVVSRLKEFIYASEVKNILLYIPMDLEVDVQPLINLLRKSGKYNIFVPYMQGESFKIVKYRLPLEKKRFNIKEPKNSYFKAKIDLAIVPVVGIDAVNKRIGFGKGMYDRFFGNLDYQPIMVFTQLELCKSDKILSEDHDIQSDLIFTS